MDAIYDLQAGHSSSIAGNFYAVSDKDHRHVSRDILHQYYLSSKEWYDLLLKTKKTYVHSGGQGEALPPRDGDGPIGGSRLGRLSPDDGLVPVVCSRHRAGCSASVADVGLDARRSLPTAG